jgi:hypothetical protein
MIEREMCDGSTEEFRLAAVVPLGGRDTPKVEDAITPPLPGFGFWVEQDFLVRQGGAYPAALEPALRRFHRRSEIYREEPPEEFDVLHHDWPPLVVGIRARTRLDRS